ncbi:MAG: cytidine deaminase [Acidobacteriota bacterium]
MSGAAELIAAALAARTHAHAPYSKFKVGAALEASDGRIFTGCNIESSSYGLTMCAERVALFKAISEGATTFRRMALAADSPQLTPPCGACRQVLRDHCEELEVVLCNSRGESNAVLLSELFPNPFHDKLFT